MKYKDLFQDLAQESGNLSEIICSLIQDLCKYNGVHSLNGGRKPLDIDLHELRTLRFDDGLSYRRIAKKYGVTHTPIYNRFKEGLI